MSNFHCPYHFGLTLNFREDFDFLSDSARTIILIFFSNKRSATSLCTSTKIKIEFFHFNICHHFFNTELFQIHPLICPLKISYFSETVSKSASIWNYPEQHLFSFLNLLTSRIRVKWFSSRKRLKIWKFPSREAKFIFRDLRRPA